VDFPNSLPYYEFPVEFYTTFLGLRHETGAKYLAEGILKPDAIVGENKRPLFKVDRESIERHKAQIELYKHLRPLRRANNKVLSYD
jgi:hypothetical protein